MEFAPIILFVYNRPWHTRQVLEALMKNESIERSLLYIYADGPSPEATPEHIEQIENVRRLIRFSKWAKKVILVESDTNKGLANSIIHGVTEVIEHHKKAIVLEDDLLTSRHFLTYMNSALNFYQQHKRVMQITGFQYPITGLKKNSAVLHRRTCSWGWATWQDRWSCFESNIDELLSRFTERSIYEFNIQGSSPRYAMLQQLQQGLIDSWAIKWAASVYLNNGLVLWPSDSLISNIGHDGSGVHCGRTREFTYDLDQTFSVRKFPKAIRENTRYLRKMIAYYRGKEPSPRSKKRALDVGMYFQSALQRGRKIIERLSHF